jgi:hypothetical protein
VSTFSPLIPCGSFIPYILDVLAHTTKAKPSTTGWIIQDDCYILPIIFNGNEAMKYQVKLARPESGPENVSLQIEVALSSLTYLYTESLDKLGSYAV